MNRKETPFKSRSTPFFIPSLIVSSLVVSSISIGFSGCDATESAVIGDPQPASETAEVAQSPTSSPRMDDRTSNAEFETNVIANEPIQEPFPDATQEEGDSKESQSLLGKASDLFNKAKQKSSESAKNASGWVQEKYGDTTGATSEAADSAMKWANGTFESLKAKGMTTADSTSEWLTSDWNNMESWEYKVVPNPPAESAELEAKLNELGSQGWECIDVRDNRLVFKKQRESYLRRLPFKDLIKLAPLMNMGDK